MLDQLQPFSLCDYRLYIFIVNSSGLAQSTGSNPANKFIGYEIYLLYLAGHDHCLVYRLKFINSC